MCRYIHTHTHTHTNMLLLLFRGYTNSNKRHTRTRARAHTHITLTKWRLVGTNTGKPTVFKVLHNHRHIKPKFPRITGKNETENKFKAADERESWIVAISAVFTQLLERERAELFKRDRAERLGGSLLLEYQRIARELYSSWQVRRISLCLCLSLSISQSRRELYSSWQVRGLSLSVCLSLSISQIRCILVGYPPSPSYPALSLSIHILSLSLSLSLCVCI